MSQKHMDTPKKPTVDPRPCKGCFLSSKEVTLLSDALWVARCDIWQTARVSEYNLTGTDPNFPNDTGSQPKIPRLIHREGLNESYRAFDQVCEALKMLSRKTK